ncbi:MAG: hypothetical protein R3F19_19305 [Verrucomicrobiales bacterium]
MLVAGLVAVALIAVAIISFQNDAPDGNPDIDLVLDGTSSGAGSSASKFLQARELLLSGNYQEAAKLYSEVAESQRSQQPTINWALFNLGVARLLESNQLEAMVAFERIVSNGVYSDRSEDLELVSFFLDLGKLVQSREPVRAEQRRVLGIAGYHCVGLLPLGLRRWELGDVKGGAELLNDFHKAAKSSGVDWVEAYARIVDPYLNDAGLLTSLPPVPEPGSEGEAVALRAFVAAGEKIRQAFAAAGGAHVTDLDERLVGAKQRLLALKSDGAKASAALVSEQLEQDREMLQREIDSLVQTRDDLQLKECAEKLQALEPKSEPGARERDAWAAIFRDADRYLAEIGKLQLPIDYRGPVVPREGVPVYGDSFALMNRTVEVRGVAGQPIAAVPFQSCSPAYLVSLGDTILKGVSDSDRFLELAAGMVSLARIFDLQSTVPGYVDLLVASADGEASGGERLRILSRVPISIPR